MPASRNARAITFAPRSWPSSPGLAIRTRIFGSSIRAAPHVKRRFDYTPSDPRLVFSCNAKAIRDPGCNSTPRLLSSPQPASDRAHIEMTGRNDPSGKPPSRQAPALHAPGSNHPGYPALLLHRVNINCRQVPPLPTPTTVPTVASPLTAAATPSPTLTATLTPTPTATRGTPFLTPTNTFTLSPLPPPTRTPVPPATATTAPPPTETPLPPTLTPEASATG